MRFDHQLGWICVGFQVNCTSNLELLKANIKLLMSLRCLTTNLYIAGKVAEIDLIFVMITVENFF